LPVNESNQRHGEDEQAELRGFGNEALAAVVAFGERFGECRAVLEGDIVQRQACRNVHESERHGVVDRGYAGDSSISGAAEAVHEREVRAIDGHRSLEVRSVEVPGAEKAESGAADALVGAVIATDAAAVGKLAALIAARSAAGAAVKE